MSPLFYELRIFIKYRPYEVHITNNKGVFDLIILIINRNLKVAETLSRDQQFVIIVIYDFGILRIRKPKFFNKLGEILFLSNMVFNFGECQNSIHWGKLKWILIDATDFNIQLLICIHKKPIRAGKRCVMVVVNEKLIRSVENDLSDPDVFGIEIVFIGQIDVKPVILII